MPFGQLDPDLGGEHLREVLVVLGQEALVADVDLMAMERGDGPGVLLQVLGCLPVIDISAGTGIGRPGSSTCQYAHRKPGLPEWWTRLSSSRVKGPSPGTGYLPGSGSVS